MPIKDLDLESAIKERDSLSAGLQVRPFDPNCVRAGLNSIKSWQIYVWEPNAVEAMHDYWSRRINSKRFFDLFYANGAPRFIEGLFQPSLHYFATEGYFLDADAIPKHQRNYWSDDILRPTTRIIGYRMIENNGLPQVLATLGTMSLKPDLVNFDNWNRMNREISQVPVRDLMVSQYILVNSEWRLLPIKNGMITSNKSLEWVSVAYKMRLFLEQPFVGHRRIRYQRPPTHRGLPAPEGLDVVKISLREGIPVPVPRFNIPFISRLTGRPLEFEVPVREHIRHCASGKQVVVKPHTRGPKGVRKEHIIKVVR
jgi:hypothetical protein